MITKNSFSTAKNNGAVVEVTSEGSIRTFTNACLWISLKYDISDPVHIIREKSKFPGSDGEVFDLQSKGHIDSLNNFCNIYDCYIEIFFVNSNDGSQWIGDQPWFVCGSPTVSNCIKIAQFSTEHFERILKIGSTEVAKSIEKSNELFVERSQITKLAHQIEVLKAQLLSLRQKQKECNMFITACNSQIEIKSELLKKLDVTIDGLLSNDESNTTKISELTTQRSKLSDSIEESNVVRSVYEFDVQEVQSSLTKTTDMLKSVMNDLMDLLKIEELVNLQ